VPLGERASENTVGVPPLKFSVPPVSVPNCPTLGKYMPIPVAVVPAEPADTFDDRIDRELRIHGVDLVCLAGYLRRFRVDAWLGRALNIHPALLPDFGGHGMFGEHVHRAVIAAGRTESGCTVHWVDAQYDHGQHVVQRRCPVLPGDTPETLADRVWAEETLAYPEAIRQVLGAQAPA
jgi:folate-dependent phosphoribosylglycinamide formyltransferase PurN